MMAVNITHQILESRGLIGPDSVLPDFLVDRCEYRLMFVIVKFVTIIIACVIVRMITFIIVIIMTVLIAQPILKSLGLIGPNSVLGTREKAVVVMQ